MSCQHSTLVPFLAGLSAHFVVDLLLWGLAFLGLRSTIIQYLHSKRCNHKVPE